MSRATIANTVMEAAQEESTKREMSPETREKMLATKEASKERRIRYRIVVNKHSVYRFDEYNWVEQKEGDEPHFYGNSMIHAIRGLFRALTAEGLVKRLEISQQPTEIQLALVEGLVAHFDECEQRILDALKEMEIN
jgi:ribosomal protein S19E (S16A)